MSDNECISGEEFERRVEVKVALADHLRCDELTILPWIGLRYAQSRFLICAESVWDDVETRQYPYPLKEAAIRVAEESRWRKPSLRSVSNRVTGKKFKTTGNFASNLFWYLTGCNAQRAQEKFPPLKYVEKWEDWAFWELIQDRLCTSTTRPTESQWEHGFIALLRLLETIEPKPALVIALGYGMGDQFKKFTKGKGGEVIRVGDRLFEFGSAKILFVKHPTAPGLSGKDCDSTHDVIQEILKQ